MVTLPVSPAVSPTDTDFSLRLPWRILEKVTFWLNLSIVSCFHRAWQVAVSELKKSPHFHLSSRNLAILVNQLPSAIFSGLFFVWTFLQVQSLYKVYFRRVEPSLCKVYFLRVMPSLCKVYFLWVVLLTLRQCFVLLTGTGATHIAYLNVHIYWAISSTRKLVNNHFNMLLFCSLIHTHTDSFLNSLWPQEIVRPVLKAVEAYPVLCFRNLYQLSAWRRCPYYQLLKWHV